MALKQIRQIVGAEIGQSDFDLNPSAKARVDSLINQGAREFYKSTDLPGCLREVFVKVHAAHRIALPPFVGEVRKLREVNIGRPWGIQEQKERYHLVKWATEWDNWTFIGYGPLEDDIINSTTLVYRLKQAEADVEITTTGATVDAARASETIKMTEADVQGEANFVAIDSIVLNKTAKSNLVVIDAQERQLSVVYNYMQEARYLLYDVSAYPQKGECPDGSRVMEVLYKLPLKPFAEDGDTFVLPDYDEILAYTAVKLYFEAQEGKEQRALMMHNKIQFLVSQLITDKKAGLGNAIKFESNPMLDVLEHQAPYQSYYHGTLHAKRF